METEGSVPSRAVSRTVWIRAAKNEYVLSPKDICTLDLIPELIEAGVYSFKIEGRMKRPEYVAAVTSIYRKYTDLYLKKGKKWISGRTGRPGSADGSV